MIRVLNIVSGLNSAGTEAVIMNYYRHIDRTKVQFDFLVTDMSKGYYADEIEKLGGKIYRIPGFLHHPFKNLRLRRAILKKYDIAELHAMHVWRYGYCKDAKRLGVKHMIFHVHNAQTEKGLLARHARKAIIKYCDEIVTCSQYAAEQKIGRKADKVVSNAIAPEQYAFDPVKHVAIRAHYGIAEEAYVIGHIGRFVAVKNHEFLIDCFSHIAANRQDCYLILKGFGDLRKALEEQIQSLGLAKCVIFADEYEASDLYSVFDLFVLPSKNEGLPVVAIEAQANGLPILLSDVITRECDIGGDVAFLPLQPDAWVKAMGEKRPRKPIPDFAATGYDISTEAERRERDYCLAAEGD